MSLSDSFRQGKGGNGMRKIVVTGMGAVTPIGNSVNAFWDSLVEGSSGIGPITLLDTSDLPAHIGGEVKELDFNSHLLTREEKISDRYTKFALIASQEAVTQAGLTVDESNADRIGVLIGTGIGGMKTIETNIERTLKRGPRKMSPYAIPMSIPDMASGLVAIRLGALGPNFSIASACATGAHAIGTSMRIIQYGDADVMITGGTEASITDFAVACFGNMKALSSREEPPEEASCPFDKRRDGFVIAEGAGVLVLESEESALARGADILAELSGYGASADAYHITAPDVTGRGAKLGMRMAVKDAGISGNEIDYINAHGTSTPLNDPMETRAIKDVFGQEKAAELKISSSKSMIGHLLGAAPAVEAIASIMTIRSGVVHPTINYREPDPDCDLDYTPNEPVEKKVGAVLSNSFGFGGHNGCLIFRNYD